MSKKYTFRPVLECLETRTLLAASLTASLNGGVLRIEGTNNPDLIRIVQSAGQIEVESIAIQSDGIELSKSLFMKFRWLFSSFSRT